jgi:hypothetical protein
MRAALQVSAEPALSAMSNAVAGLTRDKSAASCSDRVASLPGARPLKRADSRSAFGFGKSP